MSLHHLGRIEWKISTIMVKFKPLKNNPQTRGEIIRTPCYPLRNNGVCLAGLCNHPLSSDASVGVQVCQFDDVE
ncbi:MAG: hypothetical protein RL189_497 [Pseudomonadota bacterium]|jgi:hypothetical protein